MLGLVSSKFQWGMRLRRANSAESKTRSGQDTLEIRGTVGPAVSEFTDTVDESVHGSKSLLPTVVVGTVVKPVLRVASLTVALGPLAQVGCPNLSSH